jgi:2,5-diketo-D-gluconate reductase A
LNIEEKSGHRGIPTVNQIETYPFCQQIESAKLMKENNVQDRVLGAFC